MTGGGRWQWLLAFAVGCLVAALTPTLPGWPWVGILALVGLGALASQPTRMAGLALLGVAWFLGHAQYQVDHQWPASRAGDIVEVPGTVVGLPEVREQGVRFMFRPNRDAVDADLPARVLVSWFRPTEYVQPGEHWLLPLRLRPPEGKDNPDGFDYQRYLLTLRAGALATVAGRAQPQGDHSATETVNRARQYLAEVLQAETTDRDAAALKRALGIADRSAISSELGDQLRRTGTAHLLAISGLHIGMVAGLAGWLAGWLLSPLLLAMPGLDRRRLSIAAGLVAALGYAWLAGFTLPTQRALVMLSVVGLAFTFRRSLAPGHALLLALAAVLVFDPLSPLATGFWLSFAAVAVLIWTFAWRPGSLEGRSRWLIELVRAQLIIAVGLLPLNIGIFQQFIPGAVVANLVAIPMVGLWILPALLLELGGILLGLPTGLAGQVGEYGLRLLTEYLAWLDGFGLTHASLVGGQGLALLLAMAGALWMLAPSGWPARWLGVLAMLPLLAPGDSRPGEGELQAWMLDAGDGLAMIVQTRSSALIYDTGPGDGEGGDFIGRNLPVLASRLGVERPNQVVVSHAHRGHSGGIGSVLQRWPGVAVYSSVENLGAPCHAGDEWKMDGYRFRFLHPSPGLPDLGANSSCVLHVSGPGGSLLLTGGIDSAVEQRLMLEEHADLQADVVVLSAGGHRRASGKLFLDAVAPSWALASVRSHDRYGRPHEPVVAAVRAASARLATTGQCGALRLRMIPGQQPAVDSMARLRPRFWKRVGDCP